MELPPEAHGERRPLLLCAPASCRPSDSRPPAPPSALSSGTRCSPGLQPPPHPTPTQPATPAQGSPISFTYRKASDFELVCFLPVFSKRPDVNICHQDSRREKLRREASSSSSSLRNPGFRPLGPQAVLSTPAGSPALRPAPPPPLQLHPLHPLCLSLADLTSEGTRTASPGSSVAVPTNQPVAVPWVLL